MLSTEDHMICVLFPFDKGEIKARGIIRRKTQEMPGGESVFYFPLKAIALDLLSLAIHLFTDLKT